MKFEEIIKKLSTFIASFFIFFIAAGIYLQAKGYTISPDGKIYLVQSAQALDKNAAPQELSTPVPSAVNVVLPDGHALGNADAPITIYEYSSFGCFHCADFHLQTLPQLERDFIKNGKVRLVFASFPLDKKSMQAAMIAECIPEANYHEFLNTIFKNQREWGLSFNSDKVLINYASHNGISKEKAAACMKDDKIAEEIVATRQEAIDKLKIQGTPAFLIVSPTSREVIHGAPDYKDLKALLEKRLKN